MGRCIDVGDDAARACALVRSAGSALSPSTSSLLSMVSTSKWTATFEHLVAASQSSSGRVVARRSFGLNDAMPHQTMFGTSSVHACSPARESAVATGFSAASGSFQRRGPQ
jgi:hypothetical protein